MRQPVVHHLKQGWWTGWDGPHNFHSTHTTSPADTAMSDEGADGHAPPPPVDRWLQPLADGLGCGPDLEYDPEALELEEVSGKPETQFGPAEPPNWARLREL